MRLTRITAHEFLTFADVELPLGSALTAITGPNGSGKTSLARAVDLVGHALRAQATGEWATLNATYGGAGRFDAAQWRVAVDVELNDIEIDIFDVWLRGCLLYQVQLPNVEETLQFQELILHASDVGASAVFSQGSIVVDFDRRARNPWHISWVNGQDQDAPLRVSMDRSFALQSMETMSSQRPYPEILRESIRAAQVQAASSQRAVLHVPDGFLVPSVADAARAGGVELIMRPLGRNVEPTPVQFVFDLLGLDVTGSRQAVGIASIASHLFDNSVRVVDNERRQPLRFWSTAELASSPDLTSGEGLGLALFQDKTGDAKSRQRFDRARTQFREIAGEGQLDVTMVVNISDDGEPGIVLTPTLDSQRGDVPLHLSGAGRREAAHLGLLLAHDDDVLVLDEPATNLSATAQRRVVSALAKRSAEGGQTLLITHSSPLVPTRLDSIVRLRPSDEGTVVTRLGDKSILRKHAELIRHTPVRDALFASGVLLTEGETEAAVLRIWLATTEPTFEDAGVLLLDVAGDAALVSHMRILDAMSVPWAALADGPAFKTRLHNYDKSAPLDRFDAAKQFWQSRGVHTVARVFGVGEDRKKGEFEVFLQSLDGEAWARAQKEGRGSKPRVGEAFAREVPVPDEIIDIWAKVRARFDDANR